MAPVKKKNSKRNSGPVSDATTKAPTNTGKPKAASFQFDDDVPDFPRGGGSFLSRNEKDEVRNEVDAEFESEGRDFRKNRKRDKAAGLKKGNKLSADDELGSPFGDRLTGKLPKFANEITLKVDTDRQRISLGMKPSYFSDGVTSWPHLTSGSDGANQGNGSIENIRNLSHLDNDKLSLSDSDDELQLKTSDIVPGDFVPPLDVNLDEVSEAAEDGVNEPVQDVKGGADTTMDEKARRRERKRAREMREQGIRVAEERLCEGGPPKTTNEYEKLVRSSPNSSLVWIKYMAFMLSSADVDGARAVAERALKTINMTYEAEKLNVWIAYLKLENDYGNPAEEAVKRIFDKALQLCDPLKLHLELLTLYEKTEQDKLAGELFEKMLKTFKDNPEVWLRRIKWLLKQNSDGVEITMIRALMSIPRHKKAHINFRTQVALLEYKLEQILLENPKRADLWSVYLDQENKFKSPPDLRSLFERATSLSLPLKKMQFLFKKYKNYEESLGDEGRAGYVVQKAREYCDSVVRE